MNEIPWLTFLAGLGLLIGGAESLVRGGSRLAASMGVSPLIIGLTLVAYGTSTPELAVSVKASLAGQPDIALGNVLGSNIFNVLFILGLCACISPLVVARRILRLDVPLMVGVSGILWWMASDGLIQRSEGLLLVLALAAYTIFIIREARSEKPLSKAEIQTYIGSGTSRKNPWRSIGLCLLGLGLLVLGTRWFVNGAVALAQWFGLSELVIGLTIVAAGTSMPEVFTSVIAGLRGERDIAVGNVVGSNIYNILGILGVASLVAPRGVPVASAALHFDIPVMTAVAVACLPIFFTGHRIARWEGIFFLFYFAAYTAYLILFARSHDALSTYSQIMWDFVIPCTAVTLTVILFREWRNLREKKFI